MQKPLVTIGLTTFNSVDTVEKAILSALGQTWRPIEVVVVDDCSTDGTFELLEVFANRYAVIKIFRNNKNGGVAVSRNRILEESRGDFLAYFDDDDESCPDRINLQLKRIVEYEQQFSYGAPVVCHTARLLVYPHGETCLEPTMGQVEGKLAPSGLAVAQRILMGSSLEDGYGSCATCSQMARLKTYRFVGGFDPSMRRGEDTDFSIRLALAGGHFVGIGKPLVIQTMTNTPDKSLHDGYSNMRKLLEKHRYLIGSESNYIFCCEWLKAKQAWLESRNCEFILKLMRLFFTWPLLTLTRLYLALPSFRLNRAFSRFHKVKKKFE